MTSIPAGSLDRRIDLVLRTATQDALGQPSWSESVLASVWARRMEQRLSEVFAAGADRAAGTIVWRIRHRTDVTANMIIVHETERWEISAVQEFGRRVGLDLICRRTGESA